ncbi:hypothetical protein MOR12E_28895 [Methylobacterium oryzae]
MFRDQIKVTQEGDAVITTIEGLPVADHIKKWAGSDEGKFYVAADDNSGGGANGGKGTGNSSGFNPYAKDTWNFTEQSKLEKSDPNKAAQLKKAAGVK